MGGLEVLPPAEVGGNWLKQLALKKEWQTERMLQLDRELLEANATIDRQAVTIEALREQVSHAPLPLRLLACACGLVCMHVCVCMYEHL